MQLHAHPSPLFVQRLQVIYIYIYIIPYLALSPPRHLIFQVVAWSCCPKVLGRYGTTIDKAISGQRLEKIDLINFPSGLTPTQLLPLRSLRPLSVHPSQASGSSLLCASFYVSLACATFKSLLAHELDLVLVVSAVTNRSDRSTLLPKILP
jgi:hypothetical protein